MRAWQHRGGPVADIATLAAQAGAVPPLRCVFDPNDPDLLAPADMPVAVAQACHAIGQPIPSSPAEFVRATYDSLALAFRRTIRQASQRSEKVVRILQLVGGGANSPLHCQLTADACGLPVVAGPVEAAALGNALVQARAVGARSGDLASSPSGTVPSRARAAGALPHPRCTPAARRGERPEPVPSLPGRPASTRQHAAR